VHVADGRDLIRVQGARVNNLEDVNLPKRRLTVFTGVSGSGKSSLVFSTIAAESQRMGADPRSTVGTATDTGAMLRILFSRIGKPYVGSPQAFSFNARR
jgi:excinuclease UvrABC ATPase subunit